jgi:spore germination protein YaaH
MVTGWLPYWAAASATSTAVANRDLFSDASPFWFTARSATGVTSLLGARDRAADAARLRAAGIPVVPTVTDGMRPGGMAHVLAGRVARARQVAALVAVVVRNRYAGIDLDYESFAFADGTSTWSQTRPHWVAFVRQLAGALHRRGRVLTVTAPVMYSAGRGYWVYDYRAIGRYVDRLRIMTYDFSVIHPGPIAPIHWVSQVAAFAVTQLPSWKVQIGVPTYGRDWPRTARGCPADARPQRTALTSAEAATLASALHVRPRWVARDQERTFSYRQTYRGHARNGARATCTVTRTVWYDDARSVLSRAHLVQRYRLGGIALWTVSGGGRGQWSAVRAFARRIARVRTVLVARASRHSVALGGQVTLAGRLRTAAGTPVRRARVTVQAHVLGTGRWVADGSAVTSRTGRVLVRRGPRAATAYRLVARGSWARDGAHSASRLVRVRASGWAMRVTRGVHDVRGRDWLTTCGHARDSVRCASRVRTRLLVATGHGWAARTRWELRAVTYLAGRGRYWDVVRVARPGSYRWDGRRWRVGCTPPRRSGPRTCRASVWTRTVARTPTRFVQQRGWVPRVVVRVSG